MSTHRTDRPGAETADSSDIDEFGYKPSLVRSLGSFHTFAAGISYISILTGTFQLFYFGLASGGPAYWWSWPLVFVGQLMVALCFCELAARFPVAGSIYNWSKRLASPHTAWLAGWTMLTASIVSIAAVALALQATLPELWDGFQFIPDPTGEDTNAQALNGVILATILIVFTTAINAFGTKLMAQINAAGVFIELVAAVLLIVLLAINVVRGPQVVLDTGGIDASGRPLGYAGAFLVAMFASLYVMYGFDTASSLAEESHEPRKNAPKAILRALFFSFLLGGLILLLALMSAPDLADPSYSSLGGLQNVILAVLGGPLGSVILVAVVIAVIVCVLAVQAAAIRLAFAMSRDNNLPAGATLCTISPRFGTPVVASVVIGVLAIVLLFVTFSPQIYTVVTSIAIIMIYTAYLLVTVPMLVKRFRGQWEPREGAFSLGRWGTVVNIVAVIWGGAMAVNLAWPRNEVYNATEPFHWYLQWGGVLLPGLILGVGFAYYWFVQRHKTGVVAEHARVDTATTTTPPEGVS
ncbi:MAG: Urea carboxylase-related amino acid permease [uncultured Actinomycetospora sp.]|uniref:Urea carboxylase-related amino acid permease n=1 Tax=uncultured Actinomycetospora sp. TaxID=1135996 RepID=A0A6J4IIJ4_9PSEU|nr:MAG: Urea carboxylase-related amino acid permease [uncultured Actinomycetospora sp.]